MDILKRWKSRIKVKKEDRETKIYGAALGLLLGALQDHGQSREEKAKAWQDALDPMGFENVRVSFEPIDDGKHQLVFDVPSAEFKSDALQAINFCEAVWERFPLGEMERELGMIHQQIEKYRKR